jgi:hypothetical protein
MLNLLNRPKDQFLGCFWAEFARPVSFQPFLNESTAQIMLPWYIMSTKPKPNPSSSRGRTLPLLPRRPQARYGPPELRPLLLSLLLASGGGSSLLPFQLPPAPLGPNWARLARCSRERACTVILGGWRWREPGDC